MSLPYTDALVLSLVIVNHRIHRILIDTGCSAEILYKTAFELKNIDRGKIVPARHLLVGFSGEQLFPFGSIEFPVMAGTYPREKNHHGKVLGDGSTLCEQCHPRMDGTE
jgi:hypothetical protein